jgi:hypothetical protein
MSLRDPLLVVNVLLARDANMFWVIAWCVILSRIGFGLIAAQRRRVRALQPELSARAPG